MLCKKKYATTTTTTTTSTSISIYHALLRYQLVIYYGFLK